MQAASEGKTCQGNFRYNSNNGVAGNLAWLLVVLVFAAVLRLSQGLRRTLVATGSYDNVVVLRAGSESEVQSAMDRTQAGIISAW